MELAKLYTGLGLETLRATVIALQLTWSVSILPADIKVERESSIELTPIGNGRAIVDVGSVPPASEVEIALKLINPYDAPVRVGQYFSGCTCLKVTLSETQIAPKDSITALIRLRVPKNQRSIEHTATLMLGESKQQLDSGAGVTLHLKYRLKDLFAFVNTHQMVEVEKDARKSSFEVPIVCSEQEEISKLRVVGTGRFQKEFKARIDASADHTRAVCSFPLEDTRDSLFSGELQLFREDELVDTMHLTMSRVQPVVLLPNPVRLSWSVDEECFLGEALIRVRNAPEGKPFKPDLTLAMEASRIKTEVKEMASGVCRVKFQVFPEVLPKEYSLLEHTDGVIWILRHHGQQDSGKNKVYFLR